MGEKSKVSKTTILLATMLTVWGMASPCLGSCSSNGGDCKKCIANQMKYGCPRCVPMMQCMARCLWSGVSRSKCIKKCDCDSGYPRMDDCKKCLLQCKCGCSVSA
ncbi:uncharacterized protein [Primulina huaijiensis]|uniref:uncharacterized protein n=1 Tax=Primulina huaijiensis TaxID=1492673 RepID=UPI003CC6F76F